ncbi:MAG: PQQ-binding-like beta-propeller repeat protein, partial [Planctomycetales bacterium]|nr:PQQ-binding-like beta-propeller repeat protein [Planctomycetales bacterium]
MDETPSSASEVSPLALRWPALVTALYWIAVESSFRLELGMFQRFMLRVVALLVLLLFLVIWGLSRRHFTWRQRLLALGGTVVASVVVAAAADASLGASGVMMAGLPIALTAATWLGVFFGNGSPRRHLKLYALGVALGLIPFTMLRWKGLDGNQRSDMAWRWTPTSEELFLASRSESGAADDVPPDQSQAPGQLQAPEAQEGDWTSFRGGSADATVATGTLGDDWKTSPPRELWRRRVGPGWASLIAVGDWLYTQEQRGTAECVVAYSAVDGSEVWVYSAPQNDFRFDQSLSGAGPRATPTFHKGRIYAYGAGGHLCCLDAATGAELWTHEVIEESSAAIPQWGSATSPVVWENALVVFAGGAQDEGLLAYDLQTGQKLWGVPAGQISYATPLPVSLEGVDQLIVHDETGVYSLASGTHERLWEHRSESAASFQPMIQPHLLPDGKIVVG